MTSEASFGTRFVLEMRRLTNSTFGLTYAELQQVSRMEQADFVRAFGSKVAPFGSAWFGGHESSSPEQLAQAIVQEGQRRAAEAGRQWEPDAGSLLLDLLLFLAK